MSSFIDVLVFPANLEQEFSAEEQVNTIRADRIGAAAGRKTKLRRRPVLRRSRVKCLASCWFTSKQKLEQ